MNIFLHIYFHLASHYRLKYWDKKTNFCFRGLILPLQNFFKTLESITELQTLHAYPFDISEEFSYLNINNLTRGPSNQMDE